MKNKMNIENKKFVKKNHSTLTSRDVNFHKINNIMNKRLVGLVDYLTASVYFSRYNDKKAKSQENLEKFFKSKVFVKKPFIISNTAKSNILDKIKKNKQLKILVKFNNNKINFLRNKFTSAYTLQSKKTHFLKNMVAFSQYIHSEEKKKNNIKEKYPKLRSLSLNSDDFNNFAENQVFYSPKIDKYNIGITVDGNNKFTSTTKLNKKYKNLFNMNINSFNPIKSNDKYQLKPSKTLMSFDNKKEKEKTQWKKRLKLNVDNYYDKTVDKYYKNCKKSDNNTNTNINIKIYNYKIVKNQASNTSKIQKPNCYYNNLHLLRLSKIFTRNSYQNKD